MEIPHPAWLELTGYGHLEALFAALDRLQVLDPDAPEQEYFRMLEEATRQVKARPVPTPVGPDGEKPPTRYRFEVAPTDDSWLSSPHTCP